MKPATAAADVVIVGRGASGVFVEARLAHLLRNKRVIVAERLGSGRIGGTAYGDAEQWELLLNVQAGRISAFRELPADFVRWSATVDRSNWPRRWQNHVFTATSAVPRPAYAHYLRSRVQQLSGRAQVDVQPLQFELHDVQPHADRVDLVGEARSGDTIISGRQVVLATGHLEPRLPRALKRMAEHPQVTVDPSGQEGRQALLDIRSDATVLIVGTGLGAMDAVLTLSSRGHRGELVLVSRHAFTHGTYPAEHLHEIPVVSAEQLNLGRLADDAGPTRSSVVSVV